MDEYISTYLLFPWKNKLHIVIGTTVEMTLFCLAEEAEFNRLEEEGEGNVEIMMKDESILILDFSSLYLALW